VLAGTELNRVKQWVENFDLRSLGRPRSNRVHQLHRLVENSARLAKDHNWQEQVRPGNPVILPGPLGVEQLRNAPLHLGDINRAGGQTNGESKEPVHDSTVQDLTLHPHAG